MNPRNLNKIETQLTATIKEVAQAREALRLANEKMEGVCMRLNWLSREMDVCRLEVS